MRFAFAIFSATIFFATACKPTLTPSQAKSIVGHDTDGKDKALALLPVKNAYSAATVSKLTALGLEAVEKKLQAPLLAFVECAAGEGKTPEAWIAKMEQAALADELVVNSARALFIGKDSLVAVPSCHVEASFLVTYPLIEYAFDNLTKIPSKLSSDPAEAALDRTTVMLAQAFFLAMRGEYDAKATSDVSPMLAKIMAIGERHYAVQLKDAKAVRQSMNQYDASFVPCYSGSKKPTLPAWALEIASQSFDCVKVAGKSTFNFSPGVGPNGYPKVRRELRIAVAEYHLALFLSPDHSALNMQLFDLMTTTTAWSKLHSVNAALVDALVSTDPTRKGPATSLALLEGEEGFPSEAPPAGAVAAPEPTLFDSGASAEVQAPLSAPSWGNGADSPNVNWVGNAPLPADYNPYANQGGINADPSYTPVVESERQIAERNIANPVLDGVDYNRNQAPYVMTPADRAAVVQTDDNTRILAGDDTAAAKAAADNFLTGQSPYFPLRADQSRDARAETHLANSTTAAVLARGVAAQPDSELPNYGSYFKSRTGQELSGDPTAARQQLQGVFNQDSNLALQAYGKVSAEAHFQREANAAQSGTVGSTTYSRVSPRPETSNAATGGAILESLAGGYSVATSQTVAEAGATGGFTHLHKLIEQRQKVWDQNYGTTHDRLGRPKARR